MEEAGGVQSIVSQSVGHDWSDLSCAHAQMDLETVGRTEWNKSERGRKISYINAQMWNLENDTDEPVYKAEIESQT